VKVYIEQQSQHQTGSYSKAKAQEQDQRRFTEKTTVIQCCIYQQKLQSQTLTASDGPA